MLETWKTTHCSSLRAGINSTYEPHPGSLLFWLLCLFFPSDLVWTLEKRSRCQATPTEVHSVSGFVHIAIFLLFTMSWEFSSSSTWPLNSGLQIFSSTSSVPHATLELWSYSFFLLSCWQWHTWLILVVLQSSTYSFGCALWSEIFSANSELQNHSQGNLNQSKCLLHLLHSCFPKLAIVLTINSICLFTGWGK